MKGLPFWAKSPILPPMLPPRLLMRLLGALALAAISNVFSAPTSHAQTLCLQDVTLRNPIVPRDDLGGVTYFTAIGQFLACSGNGAILHSPDSGNWTRQVISGSPVLHSIASSSSTVVTVGDGGKILYSTNGTTWNNATVQGTAPTANLRRVKYAASQGIFIAVGDAGTALFSPNGTIWGTISTAALGVTNDLFGVHYADNLGLYVAVGGNGTLIVADSGNFLTQWQQFSADTSQDLRGVTGGSGNFAKIETSGNLLFSTVANVTTPVQATLRSSSDGQTWIDNIVPTFTFFGNITNAQTLMGPGGPADTNYFVFFESGNLGESPNGSSNWNPVPNVHALGPLHDAVSTPNNASWVVVGGNTTLIHAAGTIDDFQGVYVGIFGDYRGITAGNSTLTVVEAGNGTIVSSVDGGVTWKHNIFQLADNTSVTQDISAIAYSGDLGDYVAVGINATVLFSSNLQTWSNATITPNLTTQFFDVISTKTPSAFLIACGNQGTMIKSGTGASWSTTGLGLTTNALRGLATDNGGTFTAKFVSVGDRGTILASTNSASGWTRRTNIVPAITGNNGFRAVDYGNGLFLAVGTNGTAYVSYDTSAWTQTSLNTSEDLNSVKYVDGFWVAMGNSGNIYLSLDTVNWLPCVGPDAAGVGYQKCVATSLGLVFLSNAGNTFSATVPSVIPSVQVTQQPKKVQGVGGRSVSFTVAGSGGGTLFYQWRLNGVNLANGGGVSGAQSATLTIDPVGAKYLGNYTVVVSNGFRSVVSNAAALSLLFPPSIVTQPKNQRVSLKQVVLFSVKAAGTPPLKYQWFWKGQRLVDSNAIRGSSTASLIIKLASPKRNGNYQVSVTNRFGQITSKAATLTVK